MYLDRYRKEDNMIGFIIKRLISMIPILIGFWKRMKLTGKKRKKQQHYILNRFDLFLMRSNGTTLQWMQREGYFFYALE